MTTPSLVTSDWLAQHLDDDDIRIIDATVILALDPAGGEPTIESGRSGWADAHVPGAQFADLIELSNPDDPLPFMLPSAALFSAAMSRLGIGPGTHVVVYDARDGIWATRLWWMLRVFGFDAVSVLDGGLTAWLADGRPVSSDAPVQPPATFEAHLRPELVASRDEVESMLGSDSACLVNALPQPLFSGKVPIAHGRSGRIPGSVSVPAASLTDPATNRLRPLDHIRELCVSTGALDPQRRIVAYCGGGIAATMAAFALSLVGRDDVAVYDGSLVDWAADPDRQLETG